MSPLQHSAGRPFPRPARSDPKSRATIRANWLRLLTEAEAVGARGAAGDFPDREAAPLFAGLVARFASQAFPLDYLSAGKAARGFREFAQAFVTAAQPQLRAELAAAMAAAATCCRRMLEIDVAAQAAELRRRTGEREED